MSMRRAINDKCRDCIYAPLAMTPAQVRAGELTGWLRGLVKSRSSDE